MIDIELHPSFRRAYKKRMVNNPKLSVHYRERLALFIVNPKHPLLRDHALKGEKEGKRSFSITGDIRVIYAMLDEATALFLDIGSHNQVY